MVNLSKEEIKQLTGRNDWLAKDMNPIYVTTAVRRGKLSPGLKWRIDNCNKIYHTRNVNTGINYNFIFQVVSFDEMGLFYNCVNLILMEYNDHGEIVPVINNTTGSYFAFFVQLNDLDKYFKRYYTYNALNGFGKEEMYCFNDVGINFKVVTDKIHKTVTVTNVTKLLVDNKAEPYLSAKAFCHSNDTFDFNTGKQIAMDKWNVKWKKWFDGMIKHKKMVEEQKNQTKELEKKKAEEVNKLNSQNIKLTKCDDFIGTHFGNYTVVEIHHRDNNKHVYWLLRCPNCGKEIITTKSNLIKGKVNVECSCKLNECINDTNSDMEDTNPTADFVSDPDNYKLVTKDDIFITGLSAKKDKEKSAELKVTTTTSSLVQDGYVTFIEEDRDLFSMPMWYHVAHCIPADLTFHGNIAKTINEYWNVGEILDERVLQPRVGTVSKVNNVFNLIASPKKFVRTNMDVLSQCVQDLAERCYDEDVYYLAMPRIGCGSNKLNWTEVRQIILETFSDYYTETNEDNFENKTITIVVCNGEPKVKED